MTESSSEDDSDGTPPLTADSESDDEVSVELTEVVREAAATGVIGAATVGGSRVAEEAGCAFDKFEALGGAGHVVVLMHCVSSCMAMSAGFAPQVVARYGRPVGPAPVHPAAFVQGTGRTNMHVIHLVTKRNANEKPTLVDLRSALADAFASAVAVKASRVVMPRIGAGIDGLP